MNVFKAIMKINNSDRGCDLWLITKIFGQPSTYNGIETHIMAWKWHVIVYYCNNVPPCSPLSVIIDNLFR